MNVIATDYENYGIAYNCKYDDKKKAHTGRYLPVT